ncbi:MAG TPA: hypothetical protein VHS36_08930 [Candidatus Limnocylindrales bacterium]|jgi:hypothetical protein|nr:hypothetical protein [Candidatus Limnocylindrales bacterium]
MSQTDDEQAKEQDLRATEDSIRSDAARLTEIENSKSSLDPEDPMVDKLSTEAVELAEQLGRKARAQRAIARDLT